jgi:phage shock protein PspC (stress-responsive transcriptional regulator)
VISRLLHLQVEHLQVTQETEAPFGHRNHAHDGTLRSMARSAELVRPRRGRMIAGVCAALARRFDAKPWQVRLIFVLSCLLPGPQFLLYIALWIILPAE